MNNVNKALILAAGKGTRMLPYTKSCPKEMLAVGDKPAMQLLVEEVVSSGITDVLIVVSQDKQQIVDYFTPNPQVSFVYQNSVTGTACAVELAKEWAQNQPFAVLNGDDIVYGGNPPTRQLVDAYNACHGIVVGVQPVLKSKIHQYASIKIAETRGDVMKICDIVEKPQTDEEIYSLYAPLGRYLLTPQIFDAISATPTRPSGEKYLTDALQILAKQEGIYACNFKGERFDFGSIEGYLKGAERFAAADPRYQKDYLQYLQGLIK